MEELFVAVVAAGVVAAAVALPACAPQERATESMEGAAAASAEDGAVLNTANASWQLWESEYPLQVGSYFDGMDDVEADGKVHSHAMLYASTAMLDVKDTAGTGSRAQKWGTSCIACKSTTGTALFEEMGLEGFTQPWDDYVDSIDWFDCALCHVDGEPGGELQYNGMAAVAFCSTLLDNIDQESAVCGQCHSYIGAVYTRGGLMTKMQSGEVSYESVDPYRYGTDPDGIMRAVLEDGYTLVKDEKTGTEKLSANHPTIELFQGSVHEQNGLNCTDCHMPVKSEDGQSYTSHDASSTPLSNDEALEFCLTCHKDQGVSSIDEMRQFIYDAQAEVRELETAFKTKQTAVKTKLGEANKAGTLSAEVLDEANSKYTLADWCYDYSNGKTEISGQNVAHNPQAIREYLGKASTLLDECEALIS